VEVLDLFIVIWPDQQLTKNRSCQNQQKINFLKKTDWNSDVSKLALSELPFPTSDLSFPSQSKKNDLPTSIEIDSDSGNDSATKDQKWPKLMSNGDGWRTFHSRSYWDTPPHLDSR